MKKNTTEYFIEKAEEVHNNKYDYSKSEYRGSNKKICIICPEHGEFWQVVNTHLSGCGCPKCAFMKRKTKPRKTTEQFINESRIVHNYKYDYSKAKYIKAIEKVLIICPEHGEFWQRPSQHLLGEECPICGRIKNFNKIRKTKEKFIEEASQKWGNKYDYSKVEYKNSHTKICIICPQHGEFWQEPNNHLRWGCKFCRSSSLEESVRNLLINYSIKFEEQKAFEWLRDRGCLKLDFYLPEYNIAIECQGEQHFETFRFEKNNSRLLIRKHRDTIKKELCEEHNIKVLYYSDTKKYNICNKEEIIKNLKELYNKIISYGKDINKK